MDTETHPETNLENASDTASPVVERTERLGTATYDPLDNKLRFTPNRRLTEEEYSKARSHGFIWAPKQRIFVAPMWTPEREDLMIEWCGEVGDEDTSLVERAEARSERFEGYSEKRLNDANEARDSVGRIADGIPMGQPILVGHHSQRQAERAQENMLSGMRRAVKMWETSNYWQSRAEGAIAHAKYKERPEVRVRRIKKLEASLRGVERSLDKAVEAHTFWLRPEVSKEEVLKFVNYGMNCNFSMPRKEGDKPGFNQCPRVWELLTNQYPNLYAPRTLEEIKERALKVYPSTIQHVTRWVMHYQNRIAYEKAMLADAGKSELLVPPPRPKQLPLLNYRQEFFHIKRLYSKTELLKVPQVEMTKAEFMKIYDGYRGTRDIEGTHRVRFAMLPVRDYPKYFNSNDGMQRAHGTFDAVVFLTDSKVHEKPSEEETKAAAEKEHAANIAKMEKKAKELASRPAYVPPARTVFDDMKDTLKGGGVKVVVVDQLFPTPAGIARKMVARTGSLEGKRVLEPSAGTGSLVTAAMETGDRFALTMVEINHELARGLERHAVFSGKSGVAEARLLNYDFLQTAVDGLGAFDVILMNPPFKDGADIKHIKHALTFLKPGGRIVAICAGGPRQERELQSIAESWEPLPEGTFADQGTNVRTVLCTFTA